MLVNSIPNLNITTQLEHKAVMTVRVIETCYLQERQTQILPWLPVISLI